MSIDEFDPQDGPEMDLLDAKLAEVTGTVMHQVYASERPLGEVIAEQLGGVELKSLDEADALLRRIARRRKRVDEAQEYHDQHVRRLDAWLEETTARDRTDIAVMEALVRGWARLRRAATGIKSFSLPGGAIETRKMGGTWKITDFNALLAWLRHQSLADEFVTTETHHKVYAEDLKRLMGRAHVLGAEVPGVELVPEDISATIKPYRVDG